MSHLYPVKILPDTSNHMHVNIFMSYIETTLQLSSEQISWNKYGKYS